MNWQFRIYILIPMLVGLSLYLQGQQNDATFTHITDKDKLPLGFTEDVVFDSLGFQWIAGWDVIYRYDGYHVKKINLIDEKKDVLISGRTEIIHAQNGLFWIMDHKRVYLFNPYSFETEYTIETEKYFKRLGVQNASISSTSDGNVFIVSNFDYGNDSTLAAYLLLVEDKNVSLIDNVKTKYGNGPFLEKYNDEIYLISDQGITKYNKNGDQLITINLPDNEIFYPYMTIDKGGDIWIKSNTVRYKNDQNIYKYDCKSEKLERIKLHPSLDLKNKVRLEIDQDIMWIGGINGELIRYDLKTDTWRSFEKELQNVPNYQFIGSEVQKINIDTHGNTWVSTTNGLLKLNLHVIPIDSYLTNQDSEFQYDYSSQRGIAEDNEGNIYFSYYTNISKLDQKENLVKLLNDYKPLNPAAYSLTFYKDKLYWMDLVIDLKENNKIRSILTLKDNGHVTNCLDSNENLWLFSWRPTKLYKYNIPSDNLQEISLIEELSNPGVEANQMFWDTLNQSMWIASSDAGLVQMDENGNLINQFFFRDDKSFFDGKNVKCIYQENKDVFWVGHKSGLSKMNLQTGEIDTYNVQESSNYEVVSILPELSEYLWVGTNLGIFRFEKETNHFFALPPTCKISSIEFNRESSFLRKDGKMFFGSLNGVYSFFPNDLARYLELKKEFKVQFINFSKYEADTKTTIVQEENLGSLQEIIIKSTDRYFQLEFTRPDYSFIENQLYTYKLEGYDEEWSNPSKYNKLRYENLEPGEYVLSIKGGNSILDFPKSERKIKVIVLRAWYETWPAMILFFTVFGLLIYFFYRKSLKSQLNKQEASKQKEIDALKSNLYTNLTHEFRTPLTVILGINEQIKNNEEEKTLIERNAKNMLRITNQLLDVSKMNSGDLPVNYTEGDIINFLKYLTESFYSLAKGKNIQLFFSSEFESVIAHYDEDKLQHIIYNLFSNALKFTRSGGKVFIDVDITDYENQHELQITISDTGIGMTKEETEKIFTRFYQSNGNLNTKTHSGVGGSSGIGLTLTKELVTLMGGTIKVTSKLNRGSTFNVHLPLKKYEIVSSSQDLIEFDTYLNNQVSFDQKETIFDEENQLPLILIVEDNEDIVIYLKSILQDSYQLIIANDGQEGIEHATKYIPDLIITDIMMPRKSGYELCMMLKENEWTIHIPIIILTAKKDNKSMMEGLNLGIEAYLKKPFNREELLIRIERILEQRAVLQKYYSLNSIEQEGDDEIENAHVQSEFLNKIDAFLNNESTDLSVSIDYLNDHFKMSKTQFYRKIKGETGYSPSQYLRKVKLKKALALMKDSDRSLSEIAYITGFTTPAYFSKIFKETFGIPPKEYRSKKN